LTFSATTVSDGTDSVRPATLVSGEIQKRGETNRAQTDQRFGRKTMRIGESEALDGAGFLNSEFRLKVV
jgi:hypothetical protein